MCPTDSWPKTRRALRGCRRGQASQSKRRRSLVTEALLRVHGQRTVLILDHRDRVPTISELGSRIGVVDVGCLFTVDVETGESCHSGSSRKVVVAPGGAEVPACGLLPDKLHALQ